jgi:2-polyprenyl-3-methyl-5-hydroxy-6-metoxy-1,4-benzoquinol methylase
MQTAEILKREENERRAFSQVATSGRSAIEQDDELRIPEATLERYRRMLRGQARPTTPLEARPTTPLEQMIAWLGPSLEGRRVLEICCHTGEFGAILAHFGATVDAIDIAEPVIELAARRATVNGLQGRLRPQVMSVHALRFPPGTFDVVFGKASLHHLDVAAAADEIAMALRPGGIGVFSEPISFSPTLYRLRQLVPVAPDVDSPDERPLSRADLDRFVQPFASHEEAYGRMLGRLGRVVPGAQQWLGRVDRAILGAVPPLRRLAGNCTFLVRR